MVKCSICQTGIDTSMPNILFTDADGKEHPICPNCQTIVEHLQKQEDKASVEAAANYLASYGKESADLPTKQYLQNTLGIECGAPLENMSKEALAKKQQERAREEMATFRTWTDRIKTLAYVAFVLLGVGVIFSLLLAVSIGFSIFIYTLVYAFVSVLIIGCILVFLSMAGDVKAIRQKLDRMPLDGDEQ